MAILMQSGGNKKVDLIYYNKAHKTYSLPALVAAAS
jgi:hypothetical protein